MDIISLVFGAGISGYFYNKLEENSYLKNVGIYVGINFIRVIISDIADGTKITGLGILMGIVISILEGLLFVKILEWAKKQAKSFWVFLILSEVIFMLISFAFAFVFMMIFFKSSGLL